MDYTSVFAISAAGMAVERARVEAATLNLANAHTTQQPGQPSYQALHVVALPAGVQNAADAMQAGMAASLAPSFQVVQAASAPRRVHEPGHPMADESGFVSYPAVDTATEMMSLMAATRAYEANVAAMNMARLLALKTLEIGGNQ